MSQTAHDERGEPVAPGSGPFPIGLTTAALVLALGLFAFLHSPYFQVATVEVRGNEVLTDAELIALTGVYPGDNVLQVDLRALAARVAAHPRVQHVHVNRRLPDKLLLSVHEYSPVALARLPRTTDPPDVAAQPGAEQVEPPLVAVNESGSEIPLVGDEGLRLPVILEVDPELLQAAVAAAANMSDPLRAHVEAIGVEMEADGIRITAYSRSGGLILFGNGDDLPRKAAIAASLLESSDYAVVDVRFPRSPAVRVR